MNFSGFPVMATRSIAEKSLCREVAAHGQGLGKDLALKAK
jgi:hypothetical protein